MVAVVHPSNLCNLGTNQIRQQRNMQILPGMGIFISFLFYLLPNTCNMQHAHTSIAQKTSSFKSIQKVPSALSKSEF